MTVPPFETHDIRGRVLLIEDTSVLREIELLLLRSAGFDVITCAEAEPALAKISLHPIDLVVINSDRPEARSRAFISALRQHQPTLPVVAFTWSANVETIDEMKRNGATAVLDRPVNPAIFLQQIDALMGTSPTPTAREYVEDSVRKAGRTDRRTTPADHTPGTPVPASTAAPAGVAGESTLQPYLSVPAVGTISTIAASTRSGSTRTRR